MKEETYLPFTVNSEAREKDFTPDMELTSAVILFEAKRKRGYLFKSPEDVSFIARGYYPIITYPWRGGYLFFDGEDTCHHTINVEETIPLEGFIEEVEISSGNRALYLKTLTSLNISVRQIGLRQVKIKALIADEKLIESLLLLNRDRVVSSPPPAFTLPPFITPEAVEDEAVKVAELWSAAVREIEELTYALDLLETRQRFFDEKIKREIDWLNMSYNFTIKRVSSKVEQKVTELDEKLKKTLEKSVTTCKHRKATLLRYRENLRSRYRKLKLTELSLASKKRRAEDRKDRAAERRWSRELKRCQTEISAVNQQIIQFDEEGEELEAHTVSLERKLTDRHQNDVEKERKRIHEIEVKLNSEISKRLKDQTELNEQIAKVTAHLRELRDIIQLQRNSIENLAFQLKPSNLTVINVPFYLACYKGRDRTRYEALPPCLVQTYTGLTKTLKKTFSSLEERVNMLLQPVSKPLQEMLSKRLVKSIKQNPKLEQLINRRGSSLDLRAADGFTESLSKGLEALKVEGWLSDKEVVRIVNLH